MRNTMPEIRRKCKHLQAVIMASNRDTNLPSLLSKSLQNWKTNSIFIADKLKLN